MFEMILMFGALFGAMYFFMIRPQQKRAREQQALVNALAEGDRVMLTSGIFATIKHLGDKQAIVEIGPDTEITILRQVIMRGVKEDEDEFEYADTVVPEAEVAAESHVDDLAWAEESFQTPDAPKDVAADDLAPKKDPEDRGSAAI